MIPEQLPQIALSVTVWGALAWALLIPVRKETERHEHEAARLHPCEATAILRRHRACRRAACRQLGHSEVGRIERMVGH